MEVDGRAAKASHALAAHQTVSCARQRPKRLLPEAGELQVLYEDASLIVVDKPPGLTVHPGAGRPTGTLVHRLLDRYPEIAGVGGEGRPGIVHRLDKDTSGLLVVARTQQAHRRLSRDFAARRIDKRYLAICYGEPEAQGRRPPDGPPPAAAPR